MADPQRPELRALTGLRAYAAFWVVLFHLRLVLQPLLPEPLFEFCARGYLGVDLFFVLSGFVIAYRYGGRITDGKAYRGYLIRRIGRIYPLHLATLLALVAAATLGRGTAIDVSGSAYYVLDERLVYNLLLVHAWGLTDEASWNIPSWSISVEWFAYLVFPLLWWVVARVRTEGAALSGMAIAIVITVFGLTALGEQWLHTSLQHRLARGVPEFLAGMFIFRLHELRGPRGDGGLWPFVGLAALSFVWAMLGWTDWPFLVTACATVYWLARAPTARGFAGKVAVWLGTISYSIYLLHLPLLKTLPKLVGLSGWGFVVVYLVVVVAASALAYRVIEAPARRFARTRAGSSES